MAPPYLAEEFHHSDVDGHQRLCSVSTSSLAVRRSRLSTIGDRAFPVADCGTLCHSVGIVNVCFQETYEDTYLLKRSFSNPL